MMLGDSFACLSSDCMLLALFEAAYSRLKYIKICHILKWYDPIRAIPTEMKKYVLRVTTSPMHIYNVLCGLKLPRMCCRWSLWGSETFSFRFRSFFLIQKCWYMHGVKSDRYRTNPTQLHSRLGTGTVPGWSGKKWCWVTPLPVSVHTVCCWHCLKQLIRA